MFSYVSTIEADRQKITRQYDMAKRVKRASWRLIMLGALTLDIYSNVNQANVAADGALIGVAASLGISSGTIVERLSKKSAEKYVSAADDQLYESPTSAGRTARFIAADAIPVVSGYYGMRIGYWSLGEHSSMGVSGVGMGAILIGGSIAALVLREQEMNSQRDHFLELMQEPSQSLVSSVDNRGGTE